jgi:hypothetical protein
MEISSTTRRERRSNCRPGRCRELGRQTLTPLGLARTPRAGTQTAVEPQDIRLTPIDRPVVSETGDTGRRSQTEHGRSSAVADPCDWIGVATKLRHRDEGRQFARASDSIRDDRRPS